MGKSFIKSGYVKERVKEAEGFFSLNSRIDKRLHSPVHVKSVLCADFKYILAVSTKLQSNFIPKYQRRYVASDCIPSRKLESLHPILHIVCLVQIIPIISQVEEF